MGVGCCEGAEEGFVVGFERVFVLLEEFEGGVVEVQAAGPSERAKRVRAGAKVDGKKRKTKVSADSTTRHTKASPSARLTHIIVTSISKFFSWLPTCSNASSSSKLMGDAASVST